MEPIDHKGIHDNIPARGGGVTRHGDGDEECQAKDEVCPGEECEDSACAHLSPQSVQLQPVQRESRRQDDDDHAHQPEGAKAPAGDEPAEQRGREGGCEVPARDVERLPEQHAGICHEQHQERGERETPLEALLDLLV